MNLVKIRLMKTLEISTGKGTQQLLGSINMKILNRLRISKEKLPMVSSSKILQVILGFLHKPELKSLRKKFS